MGYLSAADCVAILDPWTADWNATLGSSASGNGLGNNSWGASAKQVELAAVIAGLNDNALASLLSPIAKPWPNRAASVQFPANYSNFWATLNNQVALLAGTLSGTIVSFDALLYWYNMLNGVTPWQALAPPDWIAAFSALTGGLTPNPSNVYAPVPQGATVLGGAAVTYSVGLGRYVVNTTTFTKATGPVGVLNSSGNIDITKYAGGYAYAQWTGAPGSGAATITLTGINQAGLSETFAWSGTSTATNTGVALTPSGSPNGAGTDLISGATSVATTGLGGSTIYFTSDPPSGRSNPPS